MGKPPRSPQAEDGAPHDGRRRPIEQLGERNEGITVPLEPDGPTQLPPEEDTLSSTR